VPKDQLQLAEQLLKNKTAPFDPTLFKDRYQDSLLEVIIGLQFLLVGLLHDVGKIGMPRKPLYIKNDNEWEIKNRNITYKTNTDITYMGLAERNLYLVSKYIPLSDAEAQAILYHDGQYIEENRSVMHKEEPLTLLAHWADY